MSQSEYLGVFIDESEEHLQAINDNLLQLEKQPDDMTIVGEIFRSAHTLKGMGATMGFEDLAHLTHNMENVLDLIRQEQLDVTTDVMDIVFEAVDYLEEIIVDIANGGDGKQDVQAVTQHLEALQGKNLLPSKEGAAAAEASSTSEEKTPAEGIFDEYEWTVLVQSKEQGYHAFRIVVELDEKTMLKAARVFMVFEVLEQAGDVMKSTPPADELEDEKFETSFEVVLVTTVEADDIKQQIRNVSEVDSVTVDAIETGQPDKPASPAQNQTRGTETLAKPNQKEKAPSPQKKSELNKTIRVNIDRLDVLMNLFEELVIDRGRLEQIASELNNNALNETVERMSRVSGDLQEIILNMRMMPVEQVFNRFPRMVRSLSKELGKKVTLEISGAETELDRTIIDEIGDPLVHLIRNSMDHGIESPAQRQSAGKPEQGTVELRAYHSGNHVFIEIEDDGAGIDKDKVIHKALTNHVVTEEEIQQMTDQQIYGLLFSSGFSTAEEITDVSGRGVGLDVVLSTFESLGGVVTVDSELGKGTLFSIQLPLTLSIIDVMLVHVGEETYAVPLTAIIETAIVHKGDVYSAHNQKVIDFRGKVVPIIFLHDIFGVDFQDQDTDYYSLVIINKGEKVAGLVVDSLIGQYDIVLKSLGNYLTNVFAISGATILGDGQVALIVDTNALIR
ncbi:two-component system, chemotaxis family, sensor kinase CheA [Alteribacillus persepolensis]|uniref:Chemotaxis protein CheA n=1 Tax=Alteribacillus persepolensis TaxID=568899 RepID=A0A1G8GMF5_9BACI|nr:chemotaxis protein CheA [Alteribacillus persepolensis]SDH95486.1 two-component system, chemotaxis family, sensor kinase CheA [Alteribacillus persepolensis]